MGVDLQEDFGDVLVKAYIRENGLVRQHLDSYNHFLDETLQEIVDEQGIIDTDLPGLFVRLGSVSIGKPKIREADGSESDILPIDARIRNLTYAAPIYLTMTLVHEGEEGEPTRIYVGDMPIMIQSVRCRLFGSSDEELVKVGEDPRDPGGYFIVNGSERVLIIQEDLVVNRVLVDRGGYSSTETHTAKVFSSTGAYRMPVRVVRRKDGALYAAFPTVTGRIPLAIAMRALGLGSDREIVNAITDDEELKTELFSTLEQGTIAPTVEDALDYIGRRVAIGQAKPARIKRAQYVLDRYLLPHLGDTEEDRKTKAYFLGQMGEKVLELYAGRREPDDKDHHANKRLKLAGDLMAMLFRSALWRFIKDVRYQLERMKSRNREINLITLVRADIVTNRIKHAIATGNWIGGRTGVSQILDRTNYLSTISHLRRVVSPLSRVQPHFEARELHPTQWGRICPVESPEGQNCGLVKNLALLATLSIGIDGSEIDDLLVNRLDVTPIQEARERGGSGVKVFLNGRLMGVSSDAGELVKMIKTMRREGSVDHEVNISHVRDEHGDQVFVNCDAGRVRRPLLTIEDGEPSLKAVHVEKVREGEWSWSDLVHNGLVEYLDAEEEEDSLIAIRPEEASDRTHAEITPTAILGVGGSVIPYANFNQSPRNTYEAAMAKQALGISAINFRSRIDPRMHLLHYPEKPIVKTKTIDLLNLDTRPSGQNFIVAVMTSGGYNIHDAVVLNKAAIERGLSRSTFFRSYEAEEKRYPGGQEDRIEIPDPEVMGYRSSESYTYLGEDGIAEPESEVGGGDVIIGRTSPPRFFGTFYEARSASKRRDTSESLRHGEVGVVDRVVFTETSEGNRLVKTRVRDQRVPEIGDKFASRHGQKGVIGMIRSQEDMPFTEDGVVPDLLLNPHAIPSRMTIGQLLESIGGKVGALQGRFVDGTIFRGEKEDDLRKALLELGFRNDGKETMYNGVTGEKFEVGLFVGIVYYQKLHHMVADKIHARARGPVQILTRQPTEGRAREGGLRFGEMEKDCLVGHGASLLLKERLLEESDKTVVYMCDNCGFMGYYDAKRGRSTCPVCDEKGILQSITVSYAFKLLIQELMSLGIAPRLQLGDRVGG